MKKILVYGSKEFGLIVKELVKQCNYEFIGFVDDYAAGKDILGTFSNIITTYNTDEHEIALAIGYNDLQARWKVYQNIKNNGYNIATLIHPQAYVNDINKIGNGSIIMAGSIVDINSYISDICVLWPGVIVNHDCKIGYNTFLSPGCIICGSVNIGEMSFIGAGAVIVDHIDVPANSFIKAAERYSKKNVTN